MLVILQVRIIEGSTGWADRQAATEPGLVT
jgi:hypothetical protein